MGNKEHKNRNNGVIWNDTKYVVQYSIYGKFVEAGYSHTTTIENKNHGLILQGERKGVIKPNKQVHTYLHENYKHNQSLVIIQPGKISTVGLSNLELGQAKLTITVQTDQGPKCLIKGLVIDNISNARIKVKNDLSIAKLTQKQVKEIIQRQSKDELPSDVDQQRYGDRQKNRQQYIEGLKKLGNINSK